MFGDEDIPYHMVRLDNQLYELEVKGLGVDNLGPNSIIFQDINRLCKTICYLHKLKV